MSRRVLKITFGFTVAQTSSLFATALRGASQVRFASHTYAGSDPYLFPIPVVSGLGGETVHHR